MVPLSRWHEFRAQIPGLALEGSEFSLLPSKLEFGGTSVHPGLAFCEQP
jgi:hypothetical protein